MNISLYYNKNLNTQKPHNGSVLVDYRSTIPIQCTSDKVVLKSLSFKGIANQETHILNIFKKLNITENQLIKTTVKKENLIGEGEEAKVYNFAENELSNYVLRVKKNASRQINKISAVEDPFLPENFGQAIASLGEKYAIHKKVNGIVGGIPAKSVSKLDDLMDDKPYAEMVKTKVFKEAIDKHCQNLEKIANMPQSSFEKLLCKVSLLKKQGYELDSNPNNLIIDAASQELNIIDYYKSTDKPDNGLDKVLNLLTGTGDYDFFKSKNLDNQEYKDTMKRLILSRRTIVIKALKSAKNSDIALPLPNDKFMNKVLKTNYLKNEWNELYTAIMKGRTSDS